MLTGFTIAGYIIADGLGVRAAGPTLAHRSPTSPGSNILEGPWLLALAFWLRRRQCRALPASAPGIAASSAALIANTGYGIAIYALVLGPMAHVAALRETSVLFGALIGTLLLGEPFGLRRVAAAIVIVIGLVLMNGRATRFEWTQSTSRRDSRSNVRRPGDRPPAVEEDVERAHIATSRRSAPFGDDVAPAHALFEELSREQADGEESQADDEADAAAMPDQRRRRRSDCSAQREVVTDRLRSAPPRAWRARIGRAG